MQNSWVRALLPGLLIGVTGCPDITVDPGEGVNDLGDPAPTVEFDPANRIVPFPNNLLIDPTTNKVNVPASCGETPAAQAIRENVLNQLDGFGTFETAISVTFTEPVDPASLAGNVLLYQASGAMPVDPTTAEPIPVITIPGTSIRFDADCQNPTPVASVTIVPTVPLQERSNYIVALREGIQTPEGEAFGPSFTWALIRQENNPVTVDDAGNIVSDRTPLDPTDPADRESLLGLNTLWNVHAPVMMFLRATGESTDDILLAWSFRTQTISTPLDPSVADSPAALAAMTPALVGVGPLNPGVTGEQILRSALPGQCQADGGPLPCQAVDEILVGGLSAPQFQVNTPNPISGGEPVPGPWGDPVAPASTGNEVIQTLIATTTTDCGAGGCPTIIFGHGLGSNSRTVFAIASQLAANGFNVAAIDFVAHGSRAVRISDQGACENATDPSAAPQCFAPFLSANLGATRDNIRQSIVDLHSLTAALRACGPDGCGLLSVDPNRILYMGMSLGGIIGSAAVATNPHIKASVLNVAGVGWIDIFENTENLTIRCSLVDALIGAGILMGDPSSAGETALCLGDEWKAQPGYRQFSAIARWVLDPADPANFTRQLAMKRFLLQEVIGDQVVPNLATENEAALTGLTAQAASCAPPPPVPPSTAITTDPMTSKFVQYEDLPAGECMGQAFPGNAFAHSSLLLPAAGAAGQLGTARMQTDAITYLVLNR